MIILAEKHFSNGTTAQVYPLTFGRARLSIGGSGRMTYDDGW